MEIRIAHLYPEFLNLYGDRGNVLALVRRAQWRGLAATVEQVSVGDPLDPGRFDLFFIGGGPDLEQGAVAEDLAKKGPALSEAVEAGAALLSICGGYQLLGKSYLPLAGPAIPGIGLFDVTTQAGKKRLKGNVAVEVPFLRVPVVGYENHSGQTFFNYDQHQSAPGPGRPPANTDQPGAREGQPDAASYAPAVGSQDDQDGICRPLGQVIYGFGNNGRDGYEGAWYRHAIGTYLHGPLLPKNPHLADRLLAWAWEHRSGEAELTPLDDTLEAHAHRAVLHRFLPWSERWRW